VVRTRAFYGGDNVLMKIRRMRILRTVYAAISPQTSSSGSTRAIKVGVREFREQSARLVDSDIPINVTRHGKTIGIYIPIRSQPKPTLAELRVASDLLER
jgi:hypothetical protein